MQRFGRSKSQVVERLPERRKLHRIFFFLDNSVGEYLFVKNVNLDFYSEKKGNGKRKLL